MGVVNYEVVKHMVLKHPSGKVVSAHGAAPLGEGWELVQQGWTVYNPLTGQYGVGQKPFKSYHEGAQFAQKHKPSSIGIGD